jgi:YVTN family beta-propeller protein
MTGIDASKVPPVVNNIILGSGTGPWGVAVSTSANGIYVTNNGNGTVSVLDTSSNVFITNIRVGFGPKGVAMNSSGSTAYVANSGSNNVSVIDTSTNSVIGSPIPVGSSPSGIAVVQ